MGHFLGMNSRVHPKYKTKYRVHNWSEYDRALVQRGENALWTSEDAIEDEKLAASVAAAACLTGEDATGIASLQRSIMRYFTSTLSRRTLPHLSKNPVPS